MRRIAMLIGVAGAPLAAGAAAAQLGCDDPAISVSTAPVSLEGYAVLFQQNGVTFYGQAAESEGVPAARILIRNGNRFPIEVSYSVLLEYAADSLPRSLSLGRHCAQIPPGQYAVAEDAAPAPPSALRVRNLTIANLATGRGSAAPAVTTPPAAQKGPVAVGARAPTPAGSLATGRGPVTVDVPPATGRAAAAPPAAPPPATNARRVSPPAAPPASPPRATGRTTAPAGRSASTRAPSASAPATRAAATASEPPRVAARPPASLAVGESTAARSASPPAASAATQRRAADSARAAPPVTRTDDLGPVRPADPTVGAWALEAAYAVFFLLSAIVMVAAGLGLVIPVLGGFALLASLGISALRRRFAGRAA